jgi:hypothetical protein
LSDCYTLGGKAAHPCFVVAAFQPGECVWTLMTEKDQKTNDKNVREKGSAKKPYKKPEFRHERVFETMALACGKIHSNVSGCRFQRKFS